MAGQIFI